MLVVAKRRKDTDVLIALWAAANISIITILNAIIKYSFGLTIERGGGNSKHLSHYNMLQCIFQSHPSNIHNCLSISII